MSTGESTIETHWARVTDLVDTALKQHDPAKRSHFLDDACDGDDELRAALSVFDRWQECLRDFAKRKIGPWVHFGGHYLPRKG